MDSTFDMEKNYNPQLIEKETYASWEKSGAFRAERVPGKKPFTIVMPPPNITGQLHMGHAMDVTMQDALTRYHRLKGDPTLWLPGSDHASIATEVKILDRLQKEGLNKQNLGREEFLKHAWAWKAEFGGIITSQLRRLGASCDWSRERFTMDEGCSKAVREVFVRLYEKGLIYRGDRIINWCPDCKTALSDVEVEYEEQDSHLWHIRYPGLDGEEGVVVATTRPETMLGDTGVAVNPDDPRYQHLIGRDVWLPLCNRKIPVVADSYVDMSFGTGAVKMTPAHDPNDYEVAMRHQLKVLRVMNDDGTMNENAGEPYTGMKARDCRKAVLEDLKAIELLVKTEDYHHSVGSCTRCNTTVEPLVSRQWFVKMEPLAKPAIEAVKNGDTRFIPERFAKNYFTWMENIRDWCISRQLWWGHRIPAWYCDQCGETVVSRETPEHCPKCGGALRQDEDVLDTWFSSALWPFSTLGWPEETEDLAYFYPTSTLVTGWDIIFFWVARMIFSGIEQMGKTPFDTVLMHGLVRDAQGRKMSKSLGNGVDPLEIIDQFGADALRFSLVMGVSPGADTRFSVEKVEAARNFANKIWNASRFVLMNMKGIETIDTSKLSLADKWILSRLYRANEDISRHMEQGDLGLAAQRIYDFAWSDFCDWYIELSKGDLFDGDHEGSQARAVLQHVLAELLCLLHPFMPFLTEEVYAFLPGKKGLSCMASSWPVLDRELFFPKEEAEMSGLMEMIKAIRALRQDLKVQPSHKARLFVKPASGWHEVVKQAEISFQRLASVSELHILSSEDGGIAQAVSAVGVCGEALIPLGELVDLEKERARLNKELEKLSQDISRQEAKLSNPGFLGKAPEAVIKQEKESLSEKYTVVEALRARIDQLA